MGIYGREISGMDLTGEKNGGDQGHIEFHPLRPIDQQ
jgi:hypothetical protein